MCAIKSLCVVLAAGILFVGAGVVHADLVTVQNPSFESPVIDPEVGGVPFSTAGFLWNYVGGVSGGYYTVDPAGPFADWVAPPPDGGVQLTQVGGSKGIYQPLVATLLADTTYTLTVDVGGRKDLYGGGGGINLGYGGIGTYGTNLLTAATTSMPTPIAGGAWELWEKTFVTGASPAGLGQTLRIDLGPAYQVLYDNVRLDAITIPEPAALVLLATGLLSLLCYAWRKRK